MCELGAVRTPNGWTTGSVEEHAAVYRNGERGLEVAVRPVRSGTRVRSRQGDPTHYVVELRQDWFATGLHGERNMTAKAETRERARSVAESFMREFVDELADADVESTHREAAEHDVAADVLTTEIAAEALADAAGYSDDLLRSVVEAETGGPPRLLAHRDGAEVTVVAGDADGAVEIETLHGVFPVDGAGARQVLDEQFPLALTVHLDAGTLYRFVFTERRETDVLVPPGTHVTSPEFERAVMNVLEEKW